MISKLFTDSKCPKLNKIPVTKHEILFGVLTLTKVLKCLNQCFARLWSWKSVSRKTASRFREFETIFPTLKSCKTMI